MVGMLRLHREDLMVLPRFAQHDNIAIFESSRCFVRACCATIMWLSRFSRLVLPLPVKCSNAAMCVQPGALGRKVIQYIVLYCLTPPPFRRYSCLNLCPPFPAQDGIKPKASFAEGKGIRLVNSSSRLEQKAHFSQKTRKMGHPNSYRPLTIGRCFSQGVYVA
jgi:hypothetical protein